MKKSIVRGLFNIILTTSLITGGLLYTVDFTKAQSPSPTVDQSTSEGLVEQIPTDTPSPLQTATTEEGGETNDEESASPSQTPTATPLADEEIIQPTAISTHTPVAATTEPTKPEPTSPPTNTPTDIPTATKEPAVMAVPILSEEEISMPTGNGELIDIMVVYTTDARVAAGSPDAMLAIINKAISDTNTSFSISGINHRLNLVHTAEINYVEPSPLETDLNNLQNDSDGIMDEVHQWRDTYQADLVSLIVEKSGVHLAFEGPGNSNLGFNVISRSLAINNFALARLIGQNLGAHADWYIDQTDTYAHGYITGEWRTIMAGYAECMENYRGCTLIPYWSNPDITYNGLPLGVPIGSEFPADNRTALNEAGPIVANYRHAQETPILPPTLISPSASEKTQNTSPTFTWSAVNGATQYELSVSGTKGFQYQAWHSNTEAACDPATCSITIPASLPYDDYTWHVRSNLNMIAWNVSSFTVINPIPTPISPSGSTSYFGNTFTWEAIPGVNKYYIYIASPLDSFPHAIVYHSAWHSSSDSCNNTTCSVTVDPMLDYRDDYYWKLRTDQSEWSDTVNFSFAPTSFSSCADISQVPQSECEALTALYNNTNGPRWSNNQYWLNTTDICMWYGVTCSGGHVTELALAYNLRSGSIPSQLGSLTYLIKLDLQQNNLNGNIPIELGNLTNLEYLNLGNNKFSGNIPIELGNLTDLEYLSLSSNSLDGNIPIELGNLTNLEFLNLGRNTLDGNIPIELGNLTSLITLYLNNNALNGSIPSEFGNLTNLESLNLSTNSINEITPAIGSMTNLQTLIIENNAISGSIPPELGNLTNLVILDISRNLLSGTIPSEFENMMSLDDLDISQNQLSGTIPPEFGNMNSLFILDLGKNQLSGSIPLELGNMASLNRLYLNNNQLSGSIPSTLGNIPHLKTLYLYGNQLSGAIPPELGNLTILKTLSLSYNSSLTGPLPLNLTNLQNLEYFGYVNTQLCQPADAAFLAWMAGIVNHWGTVSCANYMLLPPTLYTPQWSTDDRTTEFSWAQSQFENTEYEIYLSSMEHGTIYNVVNTNTLGVNCSDGICSFSHPDPLPFDRYNWRLRARIEGAGIGQWTETNYFNVNPAPPTLIAPSQDDIVTTNLPTFSWNEVAGVTEYRLQVTGDTLGTVIYSWYNASNCVEGTCSITPAFLNADNYTWKVQPRVVFIFGPITQYYYGKWSETESFSIPAPPPPPTLISPSGYLTNTAPDFSWSPVDEATGYDIYLTNKDAGVIYNVVDTDSLQLNTNSEGIAEAIQSTELTHGDYTWYLRAKRDGIGPGAWSSGVSFTIGPEATTPNAPNRGLEQNTVSPTFTWDEVNGVPWYRLQVTGDTLGTVVYAWYNASTCADGTCAVTPGALAADSYTWQVQTWKNVYGPWSSSRTFSIPASPAVPTLSAPTGSLTNTTPTFTWQVSPSATDYHFYLKGTRSGIVYSTVSTSSLGAACTLSTCSLTINQPLAFDDYTWYLRSARENVGNSRWSAGTTFTLNAPAATLIAPGSGAEQNTASPTFTWDEVSGVTWYRLQVTGDTLGTVIYKWFNASNCTDGTCSVTPGTLAGGNYTWKVQTYANVYGEWSNSKTFSIPAAPVAPTLSAPAGNIVESNPTFTWQVSPDATDYHFYLKSARSGVVYSVVSTNSLGAACSDDTCSLTLSQPLAFDDYTWYLRSTRDNVGTSRWSAGTAFTVGPGLAALSSPSGGGELATTSPTFTWNEALNAQWYRLIVTGDSKGLVVNKWYNTAAVCNDGVCSVSPGTLPGDSYTWQIQTWATVYGPLSDSAAFRIPGPPPAAVLLEPQGTISDTTPTFTWNEALGADGYSLYLTGPNGVVHSTVSYTTLNDAACDGATCAAAQPTDLPFGNYTWYIRSERAGFGSGPWSRAMTFTIGPAAPTLTAPEDGSTTATATPAISWQPSAGANYYNLQIKNQTGAQILHKWYLNTTICTADTCQLISPTLASGGYTWRVCTWAGVYGECNPWYSFTILD